MIPDGDDPQKDWLSTAKRALAKQHPGLTWDAFARLIGIEPRALKTYRMPAGTSGYRAMPPLVRATINKLLQRPTQASLPLSADNTRPHTTDLDETLLPALAALVMRQSRVALVENQVISGVTRGKDGTIGLTAEDRTTMALVSRVCLMHKLPDYGAEIHELLAMCTKPFGAWLDIPCVHEQDLSDVCLIDAETAATTEDAIALGEGVPGANARVEEQLFARLRENLAQFPGSSAAHYYTLIRRFVIENPILADRPSAYLKDIPSTLWQVLADFYEPVPSAWGFDGQVPVCAHCNGALCRPENGGLVCRISACAEATVKTKQKGNAPLATLRRVKLGISQYWVEPGIDELALFKQLTRMKLPAVLYPEMDRTDIAVGQVGIDLKAHKSPTLLASKLRQSLGGLAYYPVKVIAVPDRLLLKHHNYLSRLESALGNPAVRCLSVRDVAAQFRKGELHA